MIKKRDAFILLCALAVIAVLWILRGTYMNQGAHALAVRVYVDGALYTQSPVTPGEALTVTQDNGNVNVIRFTQDGFYMEYSTCRNQLCITQGTVDVENYKNRSLLTHVICLPNRVDVELVLNGAEADPELPDA